MSSSEQSKDDLSSLQWLIGRWESIEAEASFTTMDPLKYDEKMEFLPFNENTIQYKSETVHPISKKKLHWENGFLNTNQEKNKVSLFVSHFFGMIELSEGDLKDDKTLTLESKTLVHTSYQKSTAMVTKIVRNFFLNGEELETNLWMGTETEAFRKHLVCRYRKVQ